MGPIIMLAAILVCNAHCYVACKASYIRKPSAAPLIFGMLHGLFGILVATMLAFRIALWLSIQ